VFMTTTTKPDKLAYDSSNPDIRLKDILKTWECFQQDRRKLGRGRNQCMVGLVTGHCHRSLVSLALVWIFTGTALTGFFLIAHDCGHRSFKRRWVNDLVGHISAAVDLPSTVGAFCNYHHTPPNKLDEDNAWHPFQPELYAGVGRLGQWVSACGVDFGGWHQLCIGQL